MAQLSAEEAFGMQVRQAREARRWTQDRLRRALRETAGIDLSSTAMARLEGGKRPIRLNEVAALAQILQLELAPYGGSHQDMPPELISSKLKEVRQELAVAEVDLVDANRRAEAAIELRAVTEVRYQALRQQLLLLEDLLEEATSPEDAQAEAARDRGQAGNGQH